eukprot:145415_1
MTEQKTDCNEIELERLYDEVMEIKDTDVITPTNHENNDGEEEKYQSMYETKMHSFNTHEYVCKRCIRPVRNNVFMEKTIDECTPQEIYFEFDRLICCLQFLFDEFSIYDSLQHYMNSTKNKMNHITWLYTANTMNDNEKNSHQYLKNERFNCDDLIYKTELKHIYTYLKNEFYLILNSGQHHPNDYAIYSCTPTVHEMECYLSLCRATFSDIHIPDPQIRNVTKKIEDVILSLRAIDHAISPNDSSAGWVTVIDNVLSVLLYRNVDEYRKNFLGELRLTLIIEENKTTKLSNYENREVLIAIKQAITYSFCGQPLDQDAVDNKFEV